MILFRIKHFKKGSRRIAMEIAMPYFVDFIPIQRLISVLLAL
jgi:hypothetical protein